MSGDGLVDRDTVPAGMTSSDPRPARRPFVTSMLAGSLRWVLVGGLTLAACGGASEPSAVTAGPEVALPVGTSSCVDLIDDVRPMLGGDEGTTPLGPTATMDLERVTVASDGVTLRIIWTAVAPFDRYDPDVPGSGVSVYVDMFWESGSGWGVSVNESEGVVEAAASPTTQSASTRTRPLPGAATVDGTTVNVTVPLSELPGLPDRFVWSASLLGLQGRPMEGPYYFMGVDDCGASTVRNTDEIPFWGHAVFPGETIETSVEPLHVDEAIIPPSPAADLRDEVTSTAPPTSSAPAPTSTESASGTLPEPQRIDAPWAGDPVAAPVALGTTVDDWYSRYGDDSGCPLLAPTMEFADIGASGPPVIVTSPSRQGPVLLEWPGTSTGSIAIVLPPLIDGDPMLAPFFDGDEEVMTYADGSEERLPGDGTSLVRLPGIPCVYLVTSPEVRLYSDNFYFSLRLIAAPAPTTGGTTAPGTNGQRPCPTGGVDVLREGDGVPTPCPSVQEAQQYLAAYGYQVTVDGRFGRVTTDAVRQFQADYGLEVDGLIGRNTWEKLSEAGMWDY